jgi:hypothetical protein
MNDAQIEAQVEWVCFSIIVAAIAAALIVAHC